MRKIRSDTPELEEEASFTEVDSTGQSETWNESDFSTSNSKSLSSTSLVEADCIDAFASSEVPCPSARFFTPSSRLSESRSEPDQNETHKFEEVFIQNSLRNVSFLNCNCNT